VKPLCSSRHSGKIKHRQNNDITPLRFYDITKKRKFTTEGMEKKGEVITQSNAKNRYGSQRKDKTK